VDDKLIDYFLVWEYFNNMKKILVTTALGVALVIPVFIGGVAHAAEDCTFNRDLTIGSVGEDVRCLQQYLNNSGFTVATSGFGSPGNETTFFGSRTKSALASWQAANGVSPAVGYFGPLSRAKYTELTSGAAQSFSTAATAGFGKQEIKVLYPKGGESFVQDQAVPIQWCGTYFPSEGTVVLDKAEVWLLNNFSQKIGLIHKEATSHIIADCNKGQTDQYSWKVGKFADGTTKNLSGDYGIQVEFSSVSGKSGSFFKISSSGGDASTAVSVNIKTGLLPGGSVGQLYNELVVADGGSSNYVWSITSGTLPPGLSLTTTLCPAVVGIECKYQGNIWGTPTKAGTYQFTMKVTSGNLSDSKNLKIIISGITDSTYSVTVLDPNGGEKLQFGKEFTVKWKTQGFPVDDATQIQISLRNGDLPSFSVGTFTPNDGQEKLLISEGTSPNSAAGNNYKAIVAAYYGKIAFSDISDRPFSIVSGDGSSSVTIESFTATKVSDVNQATTLSWQTSAPTDAKITASCAGTVQFYNKESNQTINCDDKNGLANYTNQSFNALSIIPQGNSQSVAVSFTLHLYSNGVETGESKTVSVTFSPTTTTTTSLKVISPNGGEIFYTDGMLATYWTGGVAPYTFNLYKGSAFVQQLGTNTNNARKPTRR